MIIIHNFPPRLGVGNVLHDLSLERSSVLWVMMMMMAGCTVKERNAKKKNKNKEKKTDDVVSERGRSLTGNWYHGNVAKGQAKTFQRKKKNTFEKKMNRRITFLWPCCIAREYISQRHPPNFAIAVAGQKQRPYTHEVPGVPAGGIVDFFSFFFFFQGV